MKRFSTLAFIMVAGLLHAANVSFQDLTNTLNAIRGTNYIYNIPQIESASTANVNDTGIIVQPGTYQFNSLLVVGSKTNTSGAHSEVVFSGTTTRFSEVNTMTVITNSANANFANQSDIYANSRAFLGQSPYSYTPLITLGLSDKVLAVSFFDANADGKQAVAFSSGIFSCTNTVTVYARVKQRTLTVANFPAFIYTNSYVSITRLK